MGSRTAIGLDLSGTSISVAEVRSGTAGVELVRWGTASAPEGAIGNGLILQSKTVAKVIAKLLRQSRIRPHGKPVAVSLAGANILSRIVDLPAGDPNAIQTHIRDTVRRYAVFRGDATVSDFVALDPGAGGDETRHAVLAAAREEIVNDLIHTVMKAGLVPSVVDVSPLASARAVYAKHLASKPAGTALLIALDPMVAHMMVVENGRVIFMHTAPDVPDVLGPGSPGPSALVAKMQSVIDHCANDTERPVRVAKAVVCLRQDVPEIAGTLLSEALGGLPVVLCTPSSVAADAGLADGLRSGVPTPCAIGLALRAAAGHTFFPVNLNLLPESTVRSQALKMRALVMANLAALILLTSLLAAGGIAARQRLLDAASQSGPACPEPVNLPRTVPGLRTEIGAVSADLALMRTFVVSVGPSVAWHDVLPSVARRIPPGVRLTAVAAEGSAGGLTLDGLCGSQETAFRFAAALQGLESFRSARVASVRAASRGGAGLEYRIDCQLAVADQEGDAKP